MTKQAREKAVTAVYLIIRQNGKILLALRQNTGYLDGYYQVPAGHVDAGELPSQATIREAEEEIGVKIDHADLRFVHTQFRAKSDETGDRVDYYFEADRWRGEIENREPEKCGGLEWYALDELPEKSNPSMVEALLAIERGKKFTELPVKFFKDHGIYFLDK